MSKKIQRRIGKLLAFVMLFSVMLSGYTNVAFAAGAKADVWDFGAVAEADTSIYENHITVDFINALDVVVKGKFTALGTYDFGGGLNVTTNQNDRYFVGNEACAAKNYGSNARATAIYDDYTANGMWYANGTGGDNRRYLEITNVNAGDLVNVYGGASNSSDIIVHFTSADGSQDDTHTVPSGETHKMSFVAKTSGIYKIWFGTDPAGKPIVNRVVRYPAAAVNVTIPNIADATKGDYTVAFRNTTTDETTNVEVKGGASSFTAKLTPGYTYSATLKGVTGFGFVYSTKNVDVPVSSIINGVSTEMKVEPKSTYDLTAKVEGFDAGYDVSKLVAILTPDSTDTDVVKAKVADGGFTATLDPDVTYTVTLEGVNDYEITDGATFMFSNVTKADHTVKVAPKATYTVAGNLVTSDKGGATEAVTALVFTNMADDYTYSASILANNGYSVKLRDGEYLASVSSDKYTTSTHVSVKGGEVKRDLYLKATTVTPPQVDTSVKDIYVGCEGKTNNFATLGEAFAAAAVMNPASEADRVTIHIAPGTYREQTTLTTPYVSLVKEGTGDVVLTWYYGIGYKYYSAAKTGYWNDEADFDKYDKKGPDRWGVATNVKNTATGFKAEGITFETSFNKYMTDEEVVDGVEKDTIAFVRTLGADVTSKAATERATAICVEADQVEFKDCTFIGSQDTLYMGAPVRVYYKNCVIEGNTDYIFGSGNAIFDSCELRFCGYSDQGVGGYITAARNDADKWAKAPVSYKGYWFRGCTITNKETNLDGKEMKHAAGFYGRPWDPNAAVTYYNTVVANETAIDPVGWTSMSGNDPANASYKEYNTTYLGKALDTASRTAGTVMTDAEAAALKVADYFGDWTPTFFATGDANVAFTTDAFFSSTGDVLLPATGDVITVKYSLGANDSVDASRIDWYLVAEDKTETLVKTANVSAEGADKYTPVKADIGKTIKVVVTPATVEGKTGTPQTIMAAKEITLGSGSGPNPVRPSGKSVIFLAGDSTVKDYSAGAINNSGAARAEGAWGEFLGDFFNNNYEVMDYAQGGRSSRTFYNGTKEDGSDKYFDMIKKDMVEGDYLFIQFGHNDSSASYADRYVPTGTADANGVFPATPQTDATDAGSGTFKWYLQEMVNAAKAVGANPVMVTPVSRMYFDADGKITSHHGSNDEYVTITKQVAEENNIPCIDLYGYTKELYEKAYADGGLDNAAALFAPGEKTHHSKVGGFAIAAEMAKQIQAGAIDKTLATGVIAPVSTSSVNDKNETEFRVWSDGKFEAYGKDASGAYDTSIADTYWTDYVNGTLKTIAGTSVVPPAPPVPPTPSTNAKGDVDASGAITSNDAALILAYVNNPDQFAASAYDFTVADVDGDGVNATDASKVLSKAMNADYDFAA